MTLQDNHTAQQSEGVDRGLVAMFLRMTPEERIVAIDKLIAFLKKIDAIYRRPDDNKILKAEKNVLSGRGHSLFATRFGLLYVLAVTEERRGYDDLLPDTVKIELGVTRCGCCL